MKKLILGLFRYPLERIYQGKFWLIVIIAVFLFSDISVASFVIFQDIRRQIDNQKIDHKNTFWPKYDVSFSLISFVKAFNRIVFCWLLETSILTV